MVKKGILKGLVFLVLLAMILSSLTPIFILKTSQLIGGLHNHSANAFDVVLMGGSHMNGGLDPNVLWHNYGITSFNYATGGQSIDITYYLLKQVLKNYKNPIVVVDAGYLAQSAEYGDPGYISNAIDNIDFSLNKIETIMNCVPLRDRLSYFFPILKYHYRWNQLTQNDFNYNAAESYYSKGFGAGTDKYGKADSTANQTSKTVSGKVDLPPKASEYLNKIIDLCKQNNLKLILVNLPFDYNEWKGNPDWVQQQAEMYNTVAEIAKENNIPFINYHDEVNKVGLNFKTDMNNMGHLNIWGAFKVTMDFGSYLKGHYNLIDHRNDKNYEQWNIDYTKSEVATYVDTKKAQ